MITAGVDSIGIPFFVSTYEGSEPLNHQNIRFFFGKDTLLTNSRDDLNELSGYLGERATHWEVNKFSNEIEIFSKLAKSEGIDISYQLVGEDNTSRKFKLSDVNQAAMRDCYELGRLIQKRNRLESSEK